MHINVLDLHAREDAEFAAQLAVARKHADAMSVRVQARHQVTADEAGTTKDDNVERLHAGSRYIGVIRACCGDQRKGKMMNDSMRAEQARMFRLA